MEFYVGTSGWFYAWNEKRSLDWYVANSGLNAVELNASFYRFPFPNMVKSWAQKGTELRWTVKVNRLITHTLKFTERTYESWQKFCNLFLPLEPVIDFFLLQLPPSMTTKSVPNIERFLENAKPSEKFALEPRNMDWFSQKWIKWASKLGITLVSVDSPDFPLDVFNTNGTVYERMHGRTGWYSHRYSDEELREVAKKILATEPEKAYVFFNNDEAMLENSRKMMTTLKEAKRQP